MPTLNEMTNLLFGDGEPMQGATFSLEEAIEQAKSYATHKPFRIVRDWIWADLDVGEKIALDLESRGITPVMVYAHDVMYDSTSRFEPGNWVRTTALIRFTPPGFFETRNTVYVLIGEGKRKTTSLDAIMSIH